jgi:DNA invertase Pin-like site-specific DNA recombinase
LKLQDTVLNPALNAWCQSFTEAADIDEKLEERDVHYRSKTGYCDYEHEAENINITILY